MKQMRFLSYLLIAVLCIGFTSCSDDEDDLKSIIGTWEMTNTKGWYYTNSNGDKEYWDEDSESEEYQITFNSDNTGYSYEDGVFDGDFKWSLNDGKLKIIGIKEDGEEKASEATIKELTSNKLVLFFVERDENGRIEEEDTTTYRRIK